MNTTHNEPRQTYGLSPAEYQAALARDAAARTITPPNHVDFMKHLRDLVGQNHLIIEDKSTDEELSIPPIGKLHAYFPRACSASVFEHIFRAKLYEYDTHRKIALAYENKFDTPEAAMMKFFAEIGIREIITSREKHGCVMVVTAAGRQHVIDSLKLRENKKPTTLTLLVGINKCPICFADNPLENCLCAECSQPVCATCAEKTPICPFCRKNPRWFRGLEPVNFQL